MTYTNEFIENINTRLTFYLDIIEKTYNSISYYKKNDIYNSSDYLFTINKIKSIFSNIIDLQNNFIDYKKNKIIQQLQNINNDFSIIFKKFGTLYFDDLIKVCIGSKYLKFLNNNDEYKNIYFLLKKYVKPLSFETTKTDDENTNIINIYDLYFTTNNFYLKVYGIKINLYIKDENKIFTINGLVDETLLDCINNEYVSNKINYLNKNIPNIDEIYVNYVYKQFINNIMLKDILTTKKHEFYEKFAGIINQLKLFKQKTLNQYVKEFINDDLYTKRNKIIQLLLKDDDPEYQYIAFLLYDLLTNDESKQIDTFIQKQLYNSFPYYTKIKFKEAMKKSIDYTKTFTSFDTNKIPLEQQICLLKANDKIKEKAIIKLKEIKSKNEDSGSKARNYLEGLLRIPFGIYKNEEILNIMKYCRKEFTNFIKNNFDFIKYNLQIQNIEIKDNYNIPELYSLINKIKIKLCIYDISNSNYNTIDLFVNNIIINYKRIELINLCKKINIIIKKYKLNIYKLKTTNKLNKELIILIDTFFDYIKNNKNNNDILKDVTELIYSKDSKDFNVFYNDFIQMNNMWINGKNEINKVNTILDNSIHGHYKAKRQLERIIGSWMMGEQKGYCFGFEGPPGVGKCHGIDTPILLSNGFIKKVQDIVKGDLLMGDDSTARLVKSTIKGRDIMYEITYNSGDSYIVNQEHILCLKYNGKTKIITNYKKYNKKIYEINWLDEEELIFKNEIFNNSKDAYNFYRKIPNNLIIEIPVKKYIKLPLEISTKLKCYKTSVEFSYKDVVISPYDYGKNLFKNNEELNINKYHIPYEYKCNNMYNRLLLLKGIIEEYGIINKNEEYIKLEVKKNIIAYNILYIVRSLGFHVLLKSQGKKCEIIIYSKELLDIDNYINRVLLNYENGIENKKILLYNFVIKNVGEDDYYGFELTGNKRYVMGDFTVTHNTSLAKKGLSKCLLDDKGVSRPFGFIALGGSSHGSTLDGHNYTYVGSTWGRIVDILMESKCMNPIIFIDELDKVSKTEHGKEIIGILTHLIDTTQNDTFQDKYFTGIDLDLSKALFIFSYNDVNAIDKILLDRIHRIKFDNLTLDDKIIISKDYLLPEIYKSINIDKDIIVFKDEVLKYIIDNYTYEPGVRKLKEILFEIISEINLELLHQSIYINSIPYDIEIKEIKEKYLKDREKIRIKRVNDESMIGLMNGLWANSLGFGGITQIEATYFPSNTFLDFKLTGMQGDVMKESMNVAKSLAFKLTNKKVKSKLIKIFEETKMQGIHIHCPEGSTPKDGPSAGTAITVCIYSLLNNKKIKNNVAITGEINLQGLVTKIGGLELKILGGIKAGVKEFIFPYENEKDYNKFYQKYSDKIYLSEIKFIKVNNIEEVLKYVFIS
jgi:ATP-dependent Lon protease